MGLLIGELNCQYRGQKTVLWDGQYQNCHQPGSVLYKKGMKGERECQLTWQTHRLPEMQEMQQLSVTVKAAPMLSIDFPASKEVV